MNVCWCEVGLPCPSTFSHLVAELSKEAGSESRLRFVSLLLQLGIPHSFMMVSYQHKFQDEDQTRVKGSLK